MDDVLARMRRCGLGKPSIFDRACRHSCSLYFFEQYKSTALTGKWANPPPSKNKIWKATKNVPAQVMADTDRMNQFSKAWTTTQKWKIAIVKPVANMKPSTPSRRYFTS